jgi:hypothetical protein
LSGFLGQRKQNRKVFYIFFFPNPTIPATSTEKLMTNITTTILFRWMNRPAFKDGLISVAAGVEVIRRVGAERFCFTGLKVAAGIVEGDDGQNVIGCSLHFP